MPPRRHRLRAASMERSPSPALRHLAGSVTGWGAWPASARWSKVAEMNLVLSALVAVLCCVTLVIFDIFKPQLE